MKKRVSLGYKIITDATADLNGDLAAELSAVEVIPMEIAVDNDSYTYGLRGNLTIKEFYQLQRSGKFASTSQINPLTYRKCFEAWLKQGYDVIYLCFTSGLSGTISNAQMCCEELRTLYPEHKIICIDTLCASVGEGFLVYEAIRQKNNGMNIDELAQWILCHRLKVCHWFTVDTFDHLRHGGRVSTATAVVGGMLNIKPLLHVDEEGKLNVAAKPRGQKQAIRKQVECMTEGWQPELGNLVVIAHGDNAEGAALLQHSIQTKFPEANVLTAEIGPVIGSHTGPGMLAVIYWGSNR